MMILSNLNLKTEQIFDFTHKIAVKAPYFALTSFSSPQENTLTTQVTNQQPMGEEIGGMTGSEIGRHLAILGSCAATTFGNFPGKHYFLATKAHLKRKKLVLDFPSGSSFEGKATLTSFDKRNAFVETILCKNSVELYSLDVQYRVLQERLFQKLFRSLHRSHKNSTKNPYLQDFPIHPLEQTKQKLKAVMPPLPLESCAGHFEGYPCLPVAILARSLSRVAGQLLKEIREDQGTNYSMVEAQVQAEGLAPVDSPVELEATFLEKSGKYYIFDCQARSSQKLVGSIRCTLEPLTAPF